MVQSNLEAWLLRDIHAVGLPDPVPEYRFALPRRWKADFAWVDQKILVEVEGGVWVKGRHVRGGGYQNDCQKYNTAQELGWKVFRFTKEMIASGEAISLLERNIK